jgi:hypothetical protein
MADVAAILITLVMGFYLPRLIDDQRT